MLGFRCLQYSVCESSGFVNVVVTKKVPGKAFSFGLRTLDNTAHAGSEYERKDKILRFEEKENELSVPIKIFDNNEWQPDLVFEVELYNCNLNDMPAYEEYDTLTRVTILDEDFPGTLGFAETAVTASRETPFVDLELTRSDGADGKISCVIRTLPTEETVGLGAAMAQEFVHFTPKTERVEFEHGEQKKTVRIDLIP